MAKEKDAPDPDLKALLAEAIKAMPPEELRALLVQSGAAPTMAGMSPESLQVLMATLGSVSAAAHKEAIRSTRKENPNYPERSVFNPRGVFDDLGNALPPKIKLSRTTLFVKVRLNDEVMTTEEIELCNRFTTPKEARDGKWRAEVIRKEGGAEELRILHDFTVFNADDRNDLPPFTFILRELLDGADAVNPEMMAKRIADLEAKLKRLEQGQPTAA